MPTLRAIPFAPAVRGDLDWWRIGEVSEGRTLVLGATSLIGRFLTPRLAKDLAAKGARPLAISRRLLGEAARKGDGVEWIAADLTAFDLETRLPPISTIFSLSPIWLLPDAMPALIERGAGRLIAFSSTSRFTKAESPIEGERRTAARLVDGEERVIALCQQAGVGWTILRPTLIYAEGQDGNVSRLAALIRRLGVLPLAGRGGGLRQPVHAEDLAIAALLAAAAPKALNTAYNLPGGETLTYRQMVDRLFTALGRPARIVSVPPPLWALAFALARPLLPGATAAMGARMSEDLVFDGGPAERELGWAPRAFWPDFSAL
jgi:nucleoside-diphosphate-sugar epimerase